MKKYQQRPDYIADQAWLRGYLTPLELFRVAAWKTGQGLGNLTLNTEDEIKRVTRDAIEGIRQWRGERILGLDEDARWQAWRQTANSVIGVKDQSGLLALDGIGYPMATAILNILDPEVWPVMDRWATLTVFGRPLPWYRGRSLHGVHAPFGHCGSCVLAEHAIDPFPRSGSDGYRPHWQAIADRMGLRHHPGVLFVSHWPRSRNTMGRRTGAAQSPLMTLTDA